MKQRLRNRFRLSVALQVAVIVATVSLIAYTALNTNYVAAPAVLGLIVALQVLGLLRSVEKHVDTLEDFFAAIHYEDLTRQYVTDDVDAELKTAFARSCRIRFMEINTFALLVSALLVTDALL